MTTGIIVCGLNGSGKSTLGKALAEKLGYNFIDAEDLYFNREDDDYKYAFSRSREEAEELLLREIRSKGSFVFATVKGDYGGKFDRFFNLIIVIDVPKEIRLRRVKERAFNKYGERILPGGDLYEKEKSFFDFVSSRSPDTVEKWLEKVKCPVIRLDGTKSVDENVTFIIEQINIK